MIDDLGPLPTHFPQTVAELRTLVHQAAAEGKALYPIGGGTSLDLGLPPVRPGMGVNLGGLNQVIDYPARDMTITVQAGITLARLQDVLASEKQHLPVDVPLAEQATLGGALAVNVSGPRRLGFGSFRDYVIGLSAVNDRGEEIKGGGRVVKNVAGYDLCKLFIGALDTLGVITQVTLKVKPRSEEQALLTAACTADTLEATLEQLHKSRTRPVCLEVLNEVAARALQQTTGVKLPEAAFVLVVGFEDNRDAVAWQVQQLIKEQPPREGGGLDALVGTSSQALWRGLVDFAAWPEAVLTFKANLLPHAVAAFCGRLGPEPDVLLQAHAGNGIVLGHVVGDLTLERAASILTLVREGVTPVGNFVLLRCPSAWKRTLPVWGLPRGDAWLMRRVKEQLDPRHVFNPGRFVDAI